MSSSYAFIGPIINILPSVIWFLILICLAILICLEHSFWLIQQGSSPTQAFIEALDTYLKDKRVLLDERLDDYLMLKGSSDWFIIKHRPSYDECTEFRKIVFDNLFCKTSPFFFQLVLLMQYFQLVLNFLFDIGICSSATFLLQSEWIHKILYSYYQYELHCTFYG